MELAGPRSETDRNERALNPKRLQNQRRRIEKLSRKTKQAKKLHTLKGLGLKESPGQENFTLAPH